MVEFAASERALGAVVDVEQAAAVVLEAADGAAHVGGCRADVAVYTQVGCLARQVPGLRRAANATVVGVRCGRSS